MTSKRLGIFVLAFVAAWSLTGLNWTAHLDHDDITVTFGVTEAFATGDPDNYSGGPEEGEGGGDIPEEPSSPEEEDDNSGGSLWSRLMDLVESLVGDE